MVKNLKWIIGLGAIGTLILFNSIRAALDNGTSQITVTPEAIELFREVVRDEMRSEVHQVNVSDDVLSRQYAAFQQYRESVGVSLQSLICDRANYIWLEAEQKQDNERIPFEETILHKLKAIQYSIKQDTTGSQVLVMDAQGIAAPRAALVDLEAIARVMEARAANENLPSCDLRTADFIPAAEALLERSEIALGRGLRFGDMTNESTDETETASGSDRIEPDPGQHSDGRDRAQGG